MTADKVYVLIPAFNEAHRISAVVRGIQNAGFIPIVSDDGSTDGTAAVAIELGAAVLRSEKNEGKGASVRKGIQHLLRSQFEAVILMDSDGQHHPEDIPKFVRALEAGADLVLGNRMDRPVGMSWIRRLTNRVMSGVLSLLARQEVPDSQCGYRAMTRATAQTLSFRSDRFESESEMILEASRLRMKIVSVPVRCIYGDEESRIRPWHDTVRFFSFLIRYLKQPS